MVWLTARANVALLHVRESLTGEPAHCNQGSASRSPNARARV